MSSHLETGRLSLYRYHGQQREAGRLTGHDIVITTYHTIASEWKSSDWNTKTPFSFHWHRIILDEGIYLTLKIHRYILLIGEAHFIRDPSTMIFKAVKALRATHRWATTGTPVQNRLTDLSTIFQFLQVYPYSNPKIFDDEIGKPWKRGDLRAVSRIRTVLRCIALRRPKAVIALPAREDGVIGIRLSKEERDFYEKIKLSTTSLLDNAKGMTLKSNSVYFNALQRINSLRMICNLGLTYRGHESPLMPDKRWSEHTARTLFEDMKSAGTAMCVYCSTDLGSGFKKGIHNSENEKLIHITECAQTFCNDCCSSIKTKSLFRANLCGCTSKCAIFRLSMDSIGSNGSTPQPSSPNHPLQLSTKVLAVVRTLKELDHSVKR